MKGKSAMRVMRVMRKEEEEEEEEGRYRGKVDRVRAGDGGRRHLPNRGSQTLCLIRFVCIFYSI